MQKIIVSVCLILALAGCGEVVDYRSLQKRDGIVYLPNATTPFSGRAEARRGDGQLIMERTYKNGELDGSYREWYRDGQMRLDQTYKNGEADGHYREWHENGQMRQELNLRNGKEDGRDWGWNEKGEMALDLVFKNGVKQRK